MPKVLILAGDAAESLEVMYPYQRLLEEGYEVHIAAPSKKKLQFVVHDPHLGRTHSTQPQRPRPRCLPVLPRALHGPGRRARRADKRPPDR